MRRPRGRWEERNAQSGGRFEDNPHQGQREQLHECVQMHRRRTATRRTQPVRQLAGRRDEEQRAAPEHGAQDALDADVREDAVDGRNLRSRAADGLASEGRSVVGSQRSLCARKCAARRTRAPALAAAAWAR